MMKAYFVEFPAKDQCVLSSEELPPLKPDQILIKSDYSLISAGTELANYHGLPNTGGGNGDFPMRIGYSTSGHVLEVGQDVQNFRPGDKVAVAWGGHRSHIISNESGTIRLADGIDPTRGCSSVITAKIPDGVDMRDACFVNVSSFPMLGVRKLELQMGESVMIAGLGLLGLLALQYARLSGACPVMVCDFSPERRALALKLGADAAFDPGDPDFYSKIKEWTDGRGPDGVVEVTGYLPALQQALEYVAFEGRISLLGCTRVSDQPIDFYQYVHRRGVKLIGAHTNARPVVESRPGEWTQRDDFRTFFRYLQTGRLQVAPLRTRLVSPQDCGAVYHEIGSVKNPPFGNVFDWTAF
ncbi:MAG: zinc-binding alcohol dehydrogenase [Lentisphaeria bacterium]|nr:zinc-binding alcohol dehydrogenase [Lentisphaeria bacterium]MBQ7394696.1 zinc-binding alcohol dehydrogenase [Lentisphaeria bacterium]